MAEGRRKAMIFWEKSHRPVHAKSKASSLSFPWDRQKTANGDRKGKDLLSVIDSWLMRLNKANDMLF